jgi:hypothetical protein
VTVDVIVAMLVVVVMMRMIWQVGMSGINPLHSLWSLDRL